MTGVTVVAGTAENGGIPPPGIEFCSVEEMTAEVRRILDDEPAQGSLGAAIASHSAGATVSITVDDGTMWAQGTILEVDDGLGEQFLVTDEPVGNTLVTVAGHNGSPAVGHATGSRVLKDPTFDARDIHEALKATVRADSWPWMWNPYTVDLTPVITGALYALPEAFMEVISATQLLGGDYVDVGAYGTGRGRYPIAVLRGLSPSVVPSGKAVSFRGGLHHNTNTVTLTYQARLTIDITPGSFASTVPEGDCCEAIIWGTAARLLSAKEAPFLGADQTSADTQTGPADHLRGSAFYRGRFEELRRGCRYRLSLEYPPARRYLR